MANSDAGKLEEVIDTFRFRNDGTIRIPKIKRAYAYTQSVDIIIESIDYNLYESGKSVPSTQFYGYATLVFQDCLSLEIPLHFPRQRIYYAKNEDALQQWRAIAEYYQNSIFWGDYFHFLLNQGAEEVPPSPSFSMPNTKFIELPLREVYVRTTKNTQFQIEYSQYEPIEFSDDKGLVFSGASGQTDGEKDDGLPANGIQPARNSPDNPFTGNRPISTPSELGGFFNNSKLANLGNSDPNNQVIAGQKLTMGGSWILRYEGSRAITLASTGQPNVVLIPCQSGSITSRFVASFAAQNGTANAIEFSINGTPFTTSQFLNTTSDFVISGCEISV